MAKKNNKIMWIIGIIIVLSFFIGSKDKKQGFGCSSGGGGGTTKTTQQCYDELQNLQCDPPGSLCMPNPSSWICTCTGRTSQNGLCDGINEWQWLCQELGPNSYTSC